MAVISGRMGSVLNPEAAPYVPGAYRAVEDFSAEWWELVHFSPWFRDYWLRECFHEPQNDPDSSDIYDPALPDDIDSLFYPPHQEEEEEEREEKRRDDKMKWEVMTWGAEKWKGRRGLWEESKYAEKAPKIVKVKVSPRTIQQPTR
ncbi:protein EARLY RESPONSIVE TO DEHYDRATION 15-like isoform X2 [Phoenix dactylifera]|uniref:Protein EARLY RESPONSIVE TO DEHYDRATION 15-like isoform X2 n=1 Tax=Phoenix dactylifera TaxID=42345 RepID=A0A8B9AYJ7_PHODC|nr:protein EARLY RESPONSIVE TO DEHYDRATION 15-like isoform X2 [Phoenix dactylifera]